MSAKVQDRRYYVAGGPVQPGHPSHVQRAAEDILVHHLMAGQFCHVVAPPDSGKTSLVAAAVPRLRAAGLHVALVDLQQIGAREAGDDIGRWYYSIAYRLARDLRIRGGFQQWWQDHAGLTATQRLRAFFLEIVLAAVEGPIVVFLDGIEVLAGEPRLGEILAAVRACHDARATDGEYERLTFCLLSALPPERLPVGAAESPFNVGTPVALPPFTLEETRGLAAGLPVEPALVDDLAASVWGWTGGQPYLTQRLLRALHRRTGSRARVAVVDPLVETLFFAPNATREDPHLSRIAALLLAPGARRSARLTLYGRLRKGIATGHDPVSEVQRDLLDTGIVVVGKDGLLAVTHAIYRGAFTAGWANANLPFEWRGIVASVLVLLFMVGVPVWYTEFLPRPYLRALDGPPGAFAAAAEAHQRLRAFPGYRGTADSRFREFLVRQSRAARHLPEIRHINERLERIPGGAARTTALEAEYWQRRAQALLLRGDRDGALLYGLRAAALVPGTAPEPVAGWWRGGDARIVGSLRPAQPLAAVVADPLTGAVTALDERHRVQRWQIDDAGSRDLGAQPMVAVERRFLQQRAVHEGAPRVSRLDVTLVLNHRQPADVELTLVSPAGLAVTVSLDGAASGPRPGGFRLDSTAQPRLRALLAEPASGTWVARFSDRTGEAPGTLEAWTLRLDGRVARPEAVLSGPLPIPGPRPAASVRSALAADGAHALVHPFDPAVAGSIRVYETDSGRVVGEIPRGADFRAADFVRGGRMVRIRGDRDITFHAVPAGERVGRVALQWAGADDAVWMSGNGEYMAVAEAVGEAGTGLGVWRLDGVRRVGRVVTGSVTGMAVALADSGRVLAAGGADPALVRVWDIADGTLRAEVVPPAAAQALWLSGDGRWLAVADAAGWLTLWDVGSPRQPRWQRRGERWTVSFAADGGALLAGSADGTFEVLSLPDATGLSPPLFHGVTFAAAGATAGARGILSVAMGPSAPMHRRAVTWDGQRALRLWQFSATPGDAVRVPLWVAVVDGTAQRAAFGTADGDVRLAPLAPVMGPAMSGTGFIGHAARVTALAFDASGERVASGAADGTVRLWEAAGGEPRDFFARHGDGAVQSLAFDAGGNVLWSATPFSLLATDVASGEVRARTPLATPRPVLVADPAGDAVLVAGEGGGVMRGSWRSPTREKVVETAQPVCRMALSPDGLALVTGTAEGLVHLHDLATGRTAEQAVQLPVGVDGVIFARRDEVWVTGGAWAFRLAVTGDGLHYRAAQRLDAVPLAVVMQGAGMQALYAAPEGWVLQPVPSPAAASSALPDLAAMERRLHLRVDETGDLRAP